VSGLQNVVLYDGDAETISYSPNPEKLVEGSFAQTSTSFFSSPDKSILTGIWTAEAGTLRVEYGRHEFCHLIAGRMELEDEAGNCRSFAPGDSFMMLPGFRGLWRNIDRVEKYFVLIDVKP